MCDCACFLFKYYVINLRGAGCSDILLLLDDPYFILMNSHLGSSMGSSESSFMGSFQCANEASYPASSYSQLYKTSVRVSSQSSDEPIYLPAQLVKVNTKLVS